MLSSAKSLRAIPQAVAFSWRGLSSSKDNTFLGTGTRTCGRVVRASSTEADVNVLFADQKQCTVDGFWLRDHCPCASCRHPTSFHRNVNTFDLTEQHTQALGVEVTQAEKDVRVTWRDGHVSDFSGQWLRRHCLKDDCTPAGHNGRFSIHAVLEERLQREAWTASQIQQSLVHTHYTDFQTESGLRSVLDGLWRHGLVILHDVPCDEADTRGVSERLGGIARTVYEDYWATAPATDIDDQAYSRASLGLHTDGAFTELVPAVQVFHCYVAGTGGHGNSSPTTTNSGASLLVDGLQVGKQIAAEHPESFEFLKSTPLNYHFYMRDDKIERMVHSVAAHPVFRYGAGDGLFRQICFNSHHRAALPHQSSPELYRHLRVLHDTLHRPGNLFSILLKPGMVSIVDNFRVLHGRDAFTGNRYLGGCYLNVDQINASYRQHLLPHADLELLA